MKGRVKKRLSYGNVVATLALFVALAGGAYAVTKAPKNSVVSKSVKNSSLKGLDVKDDTLKGADVDESSLEQVRSAARAETAATADSAGTATNADVAANATSAQTAQQLAGVDPCRTNGVVNMNEGGPSPTLCTSGPFTLTAICTDGGGTSGTILITTTEANSFARGPNLVATILNPGPPTLLAEATDAAGFPPSIAVNEPFYAGAPSGGILTGITGVRADADAGTCEFLVSGSN